MTPEQFRKLALHLPEAVEKEHMDHPDFRVRGKIFATLGYPNETYAMVKLSLVDQDRFTAAEAAIFTPVPGGWGKKGATHIHLKAARKRMVEQALLAAWRHAAPKDLTRGQAAAQKPD